MKRILVNFFVVFIFLVPNISSAQDSLKLMATLSGAAVFTSAGDVNNDGFVDIIAGHSVGYDGRGCAKIYFGGTDFDTIPDVIMIGEEKTYPGQEYTSFGSCVASAGDVNKDGYDDVIVGAPTAETVWGLWAGKAYIFLGGSDMDTTADVVMEGKGWYHMLGAVLAPAGDVNRDGYDDVIVAAPFAGYDASGRAYIFFGAENMDGIHDVHIEGQEADFCGYSVAGIGDMNGDGFDDVLVGCPHHFFQPFDGKASIFFGGASMDSIADVTLLGDSIYCMFGVDVASAGDVNGDSFPDIIIDGGQRVKLFYGGPEIDTVADVIFAGEPVLPTDFGYSISPAGDLNKDGFDDIMISDPAMNLEKVYIFFGGTEVDTIPDIILHKPEHVVLFGYHLSSLSDINGDGYEEVGICPLIYTSNPTCINEKERTEIIKFLHLEQNYPNPFNSTTTIPFTVYAKQKTENGPFYTTLIVYNILGQKVRTLVDEKKQVGFHQAIWNGKDDSGKTVPSGIYFCQLKIGDLTNIRKMVFLK